MFSKTKLMAPTVAALAGVVNAVAARNVNAAPLGDPAAQEMFGFNYKQR